MAAWDLLELTAHLSTVTLDPLTFFGCVQYISKPLVLEQILGTWLLLGDHYGNEYDMQANFNLTNKKKTNTLDRLPISFRVDRMTNKKMRLLTVEKSTHS